MKRRTDLAVLVSLLCLAPEVLAQQAPKAPAQKPDATTEEQKEEAKAPAAAAKPDAKDPAKPGSDKAPAAAAAAPAQAPGAEKPTGEKAAAAAGDKAAENTTAEDRGAADPAAEDKPAAEPAPATAVQATEAPEQKAEAAPEPCDPCEKEDKPVSKVSLYKDQASDGMETSGQAEDSFSLGLAPGAPQTSALPGGVTPSFGSVSTRAQDWRFDFHGMVLLPLRIGFNEREQASTEQRVVVMHTPPVVPGDRETFEYTGVVPDPWVQLNFSYGNNIVTATVIVAARTVATANAFYNPPDQLGINDAFLTFRLPVDDNLQFNLNIGAFSNRYGHMGEYDMGLYNTPLVARVGGLGATGTAAMKFGETNVIFEAGYTGQTNKAPLGIEPAGWNDFADPNVGTTFAAHGHATAQFSKLVAVGGHVLHSFAQDDRANPTNQPDGSITVSALDARLTAGRYGHLYLGYAHTGATTVRSVGSVLQVLNAPGGLGLMDEYFGPLEDGGNGTGTLDTLGAQYGLSLGNLLRFPGRFEGDGPDFLINLFGMYTSVGSDMAEYDGVKKMKYGTELTYSMLSWLAAGVRYDRVIPNTDDNTQTHAILSPRVIFHSGWNSQDQVMLQYSRYFNGSGTTVVTGYPPERDPTIEPDANVVSLSAAMWW